ncbi:DMT family transporter [Kiloniella laminariae]|uniref:DMT family transporter n=1 Tax=Kiloniella laminariae TaxID=454162 RepID=A0ABT4LJH5_9PROT|nr:DMT family transporter [Kiloniella laminariae]MCZ4281253.1 DMT family transporter [Kiloniella laminariae]
MRDPHPVMADLASQNQPTAVPLSGIIFLVTATMLFASGDAVLKNIADEQSLVQILWVRYSFVFLIVVLMTLLREGATELKKTFRPNKPGLQIFRSAFLLWQDFGFAFCFTLLPIASVHAVGAVAPIIVTALSAIWLREYVGARRWAAVFVGFIGVMIILRPGADSFDPLLLLPLGAAAQFAIYQILLRFCSQSDNYRVVQLFTGLVPLLLTSLLLPFYWSVPSGPGALAGLLGAGFLHASGHCLMIMAFQKATAATLQPFNYSILIWATLLGWLVFGDLPDSLTIVGATIVVSSGLYTFYRERARGLARKSKNLPLPT